MQVHHDNCRCYFLEILYNKEICLLQLTKRGIIRLSSKFYYKSGQWSADVITVVRVHEPSSCPTDYTFCFHTGSYYFYFKAAPWSVKYLQ